MVADVEAIEVNMKIEGWNELFSKNLNGFFKFLAFKIKPFKYMRD